MHRYAIVSHPKANEELKIHQGKLLGQQPMHQHMTSYHWMRLDNDHIFVSANYSMSKHKFLHDNNEQVSMLPNIGAHTTIGAHFNKMKHKNKDIHMQSLLSKFNLVPSATIEDVVNKAVAHAGSIFAPSH